MEQPGLKHRHHLLFGNPVLLDDDLVRVAHVRLVPVVHVPGRRARVSTRPRPPATQPMRSQLLVLGAVASTR